MPDTARVVGHPRSAAPRTVEVGSGPEGGDDGRAATGGGPGAGADRSHGGRGVPAPRDLPRDVLPVPPEVPGPGDGRARGPVPEAPHLPREDGPRRGGDDLSAAGSPPPVGGAADSGRAGPPGDRAGGGVLHPPGPQAQPPGGPPATTTSQGPEALRAGGLERPVADRRH